jgi:glycerophosphoryl diester phosphodiesterase
LRGSATEARLSKWKLFGIAVAAFAVAVSLINASWMAPTPKGKLIVVAHRGVAQQFSREGLGRQDCTATRIRKPEHHYLENTVEGIRQAFFLRANMVELDVQQTKDGQMVAFHDATLECRTNGKGRVGDHLLADIKKLDAGYGYTADGGRTFPFRGRIGAIPTVAEVLQAVPGQQLIFHFKNRDPADADALAAAFQRAGVPIDEKMAFYGPGEVLARMRSHAPKSWMWDLGQTKICAAGYLKFGWTGYVPESCRGSTIGLPLNYQWAVWGWPNRFLARMAGIDTRVIMMGDLQNMNAPVGLERPEQLGEVPRSFRGYLWVEDIYNVGRALQR